MEGNDKQPRIDQLVLDKYRTLTPSQKNSANLLQDGQILAFCISDTPFTHVEAICPELTVVQDSVCEKIVEKLESRRKELGEMGLHYLTTKELMLHRVWIDAFRNEPHAYIIPAYHEIEGQQLFSLVYSIHRNNFISQNVTNSTAFQLTTFGLGPEPEEESANQKKLLENFPASKPFATIVATLSPRGHKNAIVTPPIMQMRYGIYNYKIDAYVKAAYGNNIKLGLLEIVKFTPS